MELKEAIERCKELIKSEHDRWIGLTNQEAIETVLQALEKTQTRIGTVENALLENSRLCYDEHRQNEILKMRNDRLQEMLLNSISKDKIKEKIAKIENKLDNEDFTHDMYIGTDKYGKWTRLQAQRRILEELLKGE